MNEEDKIQFLGQRLLQRGFKCWFLFFFKYITKENFIVEPIHEFLFQTFQDIHDLKSIRQIINICPRSGKTTMICYFIAYCLAINRKCNFIYTSYSIQLCLDASEKVINIITSKIFQKMYSNVNIEIEEEKREPYEDFFDFEEEKQLKDFVYKNRIIKTKEGGTIYFNSIGSQITGFGFGRRIDKGFNGCLFIDDPQKAGTVRYKRQREKVYEFYNEVLLTRANNSKAPIVNIQQRLDIEDLSGYLIKKFKTFKTLKLPLINENGQVLLPSQYTKERIEELKMDNTNFLAQYQQEPIINGGNIIKSEWFVKTPIIPNSFDFVYMTCDTAFSTKTSADNSVFLLNGIKNKEIYLLDCKVGKWGMPDLKRNLLDCYNFAKDKYHNFSTIYIENKASGQSLIQELQDFGLPVDGILPTVKGKLDTKEYTADKYTRLMEVISDLSNGYVKIPIASNWQNEFLEECETFTGVDDTHDDRVDTLIYALKIRRRLLFERPIDWNEMNNIFFRQ